MAIYKHNMCLRTLQMTILIVNGLQKDFLITFKVISF